MKIDSIVKNPVQIKTDNIKEANNTKFKDVLKNALDNTNDLQLKSRELDNLLAMGKAENLHEVTIAAEKASLALQFTIEVKNKLIDAYKEISRMQV